MMELASDIEGAVIGFTSSKTLHAMKRSQSSRETG